VGTVLQEEQEELAALAAEAAQQLKAAKDALMRAQEDAALSADKVAQLADALKVRSWAAGVPESTAAQHKRCCTNRPKLVLYERVHYSLRSLEVLKLSSAQLNLP
jgi:regulator of protease activity HflC (stomatin/prohibitin superfamily)